MRFADLDTEGRQMLAARVVQAVLSERPGPVRIGEDGRWVELGRGGIEVRLGTLDGGVLTWGVPDYPCVAVVVLHEDPGAEGGCDHSGCVSGVRALVYHPEHHIVPRGWAAMDDLTGSLIGDVNLGHAPESVE